MPIKTEWNGSDSTLPPIMQFAGYLPTLWLPIMEIRERDYIVPIAYISLSGWV
jgi:hypothetical protein